LVQLNADLESAGVTENMYAVYSLAQVSDRWIRVQNEIADRKEALNNEQTRQQENDDLCKRFADMANSFTKWCDDQRGELANASGNLQEQLNYITTKLHEISDKSAIDEIAELNSQVEEKNITFNRYSDLTIEALTLGWEKLNELFRKQQHTIEKEMIAAKSGSSVSEEQLADFKDTFNRFDRDRTGVLEKHELKACLQALDQNVDEASLDKLLQSIGKSSGGKSVSFQEFVDYMVSRTEDTDAPSTIKAAFKALAGSKDFVTEGELRRVLDNQQVEFLLKTMPNNNGQFDYNSFTDTSYSGSK